MADRMTLTDALYEAYRLACLPLIWVEYETTQPDYRWPTRNRIIVCTHPSSTEWKLGEWECDYCGIVVKDPAPCTC